MQWSKNSHILGSASFGIIGFVNFFGLDKIRETSYKVSIILFVLSYLVDLRLNS